MLQQVWKTCLQRFQIFFVQFLLGYSAVIFQRPYCRYDNDCRRPESRHSALDIDELLSSEVCRKASFRYRIIRKLQGHLSSYGRVASVCDIRKRSSVDKCRSSFQCLDQIRFQRVLQKSCHGAFRLEVVSRYRLTVIVVADDDLGKPLLQIIDICRQAKNRHYFGCYCDFEAVFPWNALNSSAQTAYDVTQLSVVHVDGSLPCDLLRVDSQCIALLNVVVNESCEQIVSSAHRMKIPCEMQVDIFHWNDLRIAATGRSALDAEYRTKRRLTQSYHSVLADLSEAVCQSYRSRGLTFTCRCRCDGCYQNQLSVGLVRHILQKLVVDLCFVLSVLFHILFVNTGE